MTTMRIMRFVSIVEFGKAIAVTLVSLQNNQASLEEDEVVELTEEQKHERKMDSENIHMEMLVAGDGRNFPVCFYLDLSMHFLVLFISHFLTFNDCF